MRQTPPPPIDITAIIPEYAPLARQTVRLHPRAGICAVDESKLGGMFLMPKDEPWPYDEESGFPFVPVLQLRAEDVPEIGFPEGKDIFQLLWCFSGVLICKVFWRNRREITDFFAEMPEDVLIEIEENPYFYPTPCILDPERVIEYPHIFDITDFYPDLDEALETSKKFRLAIASIPNLEYDDPSDVYQDLLSTADGTKVGGYPNWVQDPEAPEDMEYLLTIASCECDAATWLRWLPIEDRIGWDNSVTQAANLMLGDMGSVNIFINRQREDYPVVGIYQCS
ncbi:hypothetical protein C7H19_07040 [Aphanothece hegewaldii CCALA 016]|uniref:DUF1963 domain-containing protein n=1 Tax=Aphanothece hegewaldii CCALA 016 TaxID=2107694 RepID=A0A2T1M0N1_9CHRO|nr:DUF1963 domain-containing protein [Aphanothece hegewaldii]PSF38220.1 hypothetical protein C7H19_07040 [Aphanothece hegewaldii CCALA 016]